MTLDHARIKMTRAASGDLLYRKAEALKPVGIVFRLDIAGQDRSATIFWEMFEGTFKKGSFSRPWRTDDIYAENAVLSKLLAQASRDSLVLAQDFTFERQSIHALPPPQRRAPVHLR